MGFDYDFRYWLLFMVVLFMVLILFKELIFSFNQGFRYLGSKLFVVVDIGFIYCG